MAERSAERLWEAIAWRGGLITTNDAIFRDIECGIMNGWLDAVGIGVFGPTKALSEALGRSVAPYPDGALQQWTGAIPAS